MMYNPMMSVFYFTLLSISRIGNIKYDFAASDGTGSQALSVEQCQCPAGYEGLSCEVS